MRYYFTLWILLFATGLTAQNFDARIAHTQTPLSEVELIQMPSFDNKALMEAELKLRQPGRAPHFAKTVEVDINPNSHGHWETLDDGTAVWRLRIVSPGAYSLNLGFSQFWMPEGGSLILYSPDHSRVMGPFTPADNEEHAQLWTPILDGDQLVIEVQIPKRKREHLQLQLQSINHDFMGFAQIASGSCNLDVICNTEDGYGFVEAYRDVIQSVAVYGLQGNLFCTGFLVNNTRSDCTPFFMTAAHCGVTESDAPSLVVYWNFQNSSCREPGSAASSGPGDGQLNEFNTGALLRANYNPSDMALLELDDPVSETAEAYFAGWTREAIAPEKGVATIHHPNTDEKRISYANRATYFGSWTSGDDQVPGGNHIIVPEWAIGTTETGSSGAPLFNELGQVVGQLHGGIADCINGGYDSFGWFGASWEGGGTTTSSLRRWLDPDNTGIVSLAGHAQSRCSFFVEATSANQSICAPEAAIFQLEVSDKFVEPVNLSLSGLPEELAATFSKNPVNPGDTTLLSVSGADQLPAGNYAFTILGTDGVESVATGLALNIFQDLPSPVNLIKPANNDIDVNIRADFSWAEEASATGYEFEMANDPDFNNVIINVADLRQLNLDNFELTPLTTYYWRVRGNNICGTGDWSIPYSFTTAGIGCGQVFSSQVPIQIADEAVTISSSINISLPGTVQEMRLTDLDITHSFVGDLRAILISPQGTEIMLFDRPGLPLSFFGCSGENMEVSFADDATYSAEELEETCDDFPAIRGDYQPVVPFANLKGEPISGTWTLKIIDLVTDDGGQLNSWGLAFCSSLPQTEEIYLSSDQYQACLNESIELSLFLGTAFSDTVHLSVTGLPPETSIFYSKNPASPGATVDLTISGIPEAGTYNPVISAGDAQVSAQLTLNGPPPMVNTLQPAEGASLDAREVTFQWSPIEAADFYELQVFERVIGNTPFLSVQLTDTLYTLENLDFGATYFWQVIPFNNCGGNVPAGYQSFTSRPDLNLSIEPGALSLCQTESGSIDLDIANGFASPAKIRFEISPMDTLGIDFNIDPENITPGSSIRATLADLSRLETGNYTLTFIVSDTAYENSISLDLSILAPPEIASPTSPENNASFKENRPLFEWSEAANASNYRLQIASDERFENIVLDQVVSTLSLRPIEALSPGDYYWRTTAVNRCGGATSAAFRFTLTPSTSTSNWQGQKLRWFPNPTNDHIQILFPAVQASPVHYLLYNSTGQLQAQGRFEQGIQKARIDLYALPSGVYLLRLQRDAEWAVLRVVKK